MKKLLLIPLLFVFTAAAVGQNTEALLAAQHRPPAHSSGFYVGAFGGGVVLPTDLWSGDAKLAEDSLFGSYDVEFQLCFRPKAGYDMGLTLGYDLNEYWGIESRLHLMKMNFDGKWSFSGWVDYYDYYNGGAHQHEERSYSGTVNGFGERSLTMFDVSAHWYPWGKGRWSPYFKAGLGYANHKISMSMKKFVSGIAKETGGDPSAATMLAEEFGQRYGSMSVDTLTMPLGVGLRYQWTPQASLRVDLTDQILFESKFGGGMDIKTNHNLALTVGVTYSFGAGSYHSSRRY